MEKDELARQLLNAEIRIEELEVELAESQCRVGRLLEREEAFKRAEERYRTLKLARRDLEAIHHILGDAVSVTAEWVGDVV